MKWTSILRLCVAVAALVFPFQLRTAKAQVAGGTIFGTVTDSSARVVNNVHIVIENVETGVRREVTTNDEGFYSAPNLLPGTYFVTFSASGFKTESRRGIGLTVGASVSLDQVLIVGSITEKVTVQSEVPAVQLASSDISAVVNAATVRELPLNGRSWTDLAELQPGVSAIHTQPDFSAGTDRGNRGFGLGASVYQVLSECANDAVTSGKDLCYVVRVLARCLQDAAGRGVDHRANSTRLSIEGILTGHDNFPDEYGFQVNPGSL